MLSFLLCLPSLSQIMAHNLNIAAQEGDVNALYAAIRNNPFVLDDLDSSPFLHSPCHIAALFGKTHFVLAIITLKPSLARKLNLDGYSPMHLAMMKLKPDGYSPMDLAMRNDHTQLIRGLLARNKDLVRVNGKEGYTPLHIMVGVGGDPSLLREILYASPDSIKDVSGKRETLLHLAVKNNHYDTFKVLIEFIKAFDMEEIFTWIDEEGYTALQHATARCQIEMLQLWFHRYAFKEWAVGVDVLDKNGRTVLDLVDEMPGENEYRDAIRDILVRGTLQGITMPRENDGRVVSNRYWGYILHQLSLAVQKVPVHTRNAFLVVLVLVTTTTFQVGLNPPGGFWQEDGTNNNNKSYSAGRPVLSTYSAGLYITVSVFTTAGFVSSLNWIFLLTMGMSLRFLLLVAVAFSAYTYLFAFAAITNELTITIIYGVIFIVFSAISAVYLWNYMKLPRIEGFRCGDGNVEDS